MIALSPAGDPGRPPALRPAGRLRLAADAPSSLATLESRLILDAVAAGADALLVSGDNRLDAYRLLAQARARRLDAEVADGVWIARAFTLHQLVALLEETLPRLARERRTGLVLVMGLLEPFLDEDVPPAESRTLFARTLRRLGAWSAGVDAPVVATFSTPTGARALALAQLAAELADAYETPPSPPARSIESWGVA